MKKLERSEMKKLQGGKALPVSCNCGGTSGTVWHCYGSYSNCSDQKTGTCGIDESQCHNYCAVSNTNSGANCWV